MTSKVAYPEFFVAPETRRVKGVEIFTSGIHTDSKGNKKEWTKDDIKKILTNFGNKLPSISPIKLGHTSSEHTSKVAKALGLPEPILTGEGDKSTGAATLGHVVDISYIDGKLVAELEAPDKVVKLIDDKYFTGVSSEIIGDYQGKGPALSGLALLGAQRSAIEGLDGLEAVTVLEDGTKPDYIYSTDFSTKNIIKNKPSDISNDNEFSIISDFIYKYGILGKIFGSGKSDTTYHVPVEIEATDIKGKISKRVVTVQHKRVSTSSEARGAVIRVLERVATQFGTIIARSAGEIIAKKLASGEIRKWTIGRITKSKSIESDKGKSVAQEIIEKLRSNKFNEKVKKSNFVSLNTALIITSVVPIIANTLYKIFFRRDNKESSVDINAKSIEEAIEKMRKSARRDTIISGLAGGLSGGISGGTLASIFQRDETKYATLVDTLFYHNRSV